MGLRLPDWNPFAMKKASVGLHALQGLMIPILMGVTAGAMMQKSTAHSSVKFMHALCWLTIPGLIYVTMTPRFPRTAPLSNPYAICGFNCLYLFLWFIAPIALGSWNARAQTDGFKKLPADDPLSKGSPSCATHSSGSSKECELNKAATGLGVFMFLFWFGTSIMAIYTAIYYRIHLITPLEARGGGVGVGDGSGAVMGEHSKDAFDPSMAPPGGDYALIGDHERERQHSLSGQEGQQGFEGDDGEYQRYLAREGGEDRRSRSVGSGRYDAGRVGFPAGDYSYTEGGKSEQGTHVV